MSVTPELRAQLDAFGADVVREAKREADPYVVDRAFLARLENLPSDAPERDAIYELLLDWVGSPDIYRWHPALMLLQAFHSPRTARAVRAAQDEATGDKLTYSGLFEVVAGYLEAPPVERDAEDERWEQFEANLLTAAAMMPALGATESAREMAVYFAENGDEELAIPFLGAAIHRSDGRPLAREFAELLVPEVELLLAEAPELNPADEAAVRIELERFRSIVAEQDAGTAVPPEFRDEFEAWWNALVEAGDLDAAVGRASARLDALPADAPERHWIQQILIDWLIGHDQWRWQPAFSLLLRERVAEAAPIMRWVIALAGPDRRPFVDRLTAIADELEQSAERSDYR